MTQQSDLLDPIALSLLWSSLLSVTDEMGSTLRRTAFSQAVREADDFSTGIFDPEGRLVAQGNFTPGHLGAMPFVVKTALAHRSEEHTSELQSLMRISYAVFCLNKKKTKTQKSPSYT